MSSKKQQADIKGVREHEILLINMFLNNIIDETYIHKFNVLGITNENDIITILNGFDEIAELGYAWYINNVVKNAENYD